MQPTISAAVFALSRPALCMSGAGLALLIIGLWFAKAALVRARGLEKIIALANVCFGVPLAVFGAEHLSMPQVLMTMVPSFVPWHLFWAYFVGVALLAAALSFATRIQVRWSGLLFGIMMVLFVAMLHLPGAVANGGRILWTIVFREMSFAGGAWVLAGTSMDGSTRSAKGLVTVGRVLIAITAIAFGLQHFLHPTVLPVVPLKKEMPRWVPAPAIIDYLTGAFLVVSGLCFLLARKIHTAATYLGAWILLLVIVIYGPVLIASLASPEPGTQIEGINYFADTLLFGGVILSLACASELRQTPASFLVAGRNETANII